MTDISGLNELIVDLTDAPRRAQRRVVPVVLKAAANIQRDARRFSQGLSHAPMYPNSITFDAGWKRAAFEAEVGPDKNLPQGALGNLLEYGSANNAPLTHLGPAVDLEGPRFEKAMEDLGNL